MIHRRIGRQLAAILRGDAGLRRFWVSVVPLYFFRIRNGRYSGASERATELADGNAAWQELTSACAEMVGEICRKLGQNSRWEMELLDEDRRPVFRISLSADSLEPGRPIAGTENRTVRSGVRLTQTHS